MTKHVNYTAEQLVRDRWRMCLANEFCTTCPLYAELAKGKRINVCHNFKFIAANADKYVHLIQQWAENNKE